MPRAHLVASEGAAALAPSPPGQRYLAEIDELNRGAASAADPPAGRAREAAGGGDREEREAALERWLSASDGRASSAQLFRAPMALWEPSATLLAPPLSPQALLFRGPASLHALCARRSGLLLHAPWTASPSPAVCPSATPSCSAPSSSSTTSPCSWPRPAPSCTARLTRPD